MWSFNRMQQENAEKFYNAKKFYMCNLIDRMLSKQDIRLNSYSFQLGWI